MCLRRVLFPSLWKVENSGTHRGSYSCIQLSLPRSPLKRPEQKFILPYTHRTEHTLGHGCEIIAHLSCLTSHQWVIHSCECDHCRCGSNISFTSPLTPLISSFLHVHSSLRPPSAPKCKMLHCNAASSEEKKKSDFRAIMRAAVFPSFPHKRPMAQCHSQCQSL